MRLKYSLSIITLGMTLVFVIYAQKRNQNPGPDLSNFPTADYKFAKENKKPKSKKYNSVYAPEITENSTGIFTTSDWDLNLPALPVLRSSAIVVGEVINAEAHLSDDNTNIYSEFTVHVEDVLKSVNGKPLGNETIIVERLGGRVRMPSGKIVISMVDHQEMPQKNKRYVFFLKEDFRLITAYELRNDKVFPLDSVNEGHPMKAYTGKSASLFFEDLSRLLANS